jgi:arylsulfatase A-like enzyme
VVYGYISDAHDNKAGPGSFGPGETGYVQQLAAYNDAFGKFFARLKVDGITTENTIFIVTSDENDHFAGKPGAPAGCDGIHTPCTYIRLPPGCDGSVVLCTTTNLGEVNVDLRRRLITQFGDTTAFSVHSDDAPTVYINGNPGPTAPVTRTFEREFAQLAAFDPIKNGSVPLMQRMAGPSEMAFLHMITKDPARTPTFTYFADADFFLFASSTVPCPTLVACSSEQPSFNWNHGDFQKDITHTWLGIVGPGVERQGRTGAFFSDHTDVRPTLLLLAGLKDDYAHDGRVLFEVLDEEAVPRSLGRHGETLERLAHAYKAINAPVGELGLRTLKISTTGLAGDDATFAAVDGRINDITARRNMIAGQMIAMLENAAFNNTPINEENAEELIEAANELIESAH